MVFAFIVSFLILFAILLYCKKALFKRDLPVNDLLLIALLCVGYLGLQYGVDYLLVAKKNQSKATETSVEIITETAANPKIEFNPYEGSSSLAVRLIPADKNNTRLGNLPGLIKAKKEVSQLIGFIENPDKFKRLGARPPTGLILYGPPGTGKTLLAKGIAGEAELNLYAVSGSAFEESYVGIGAARIRELFETARKNTPAIILIDEIDALIPTRSQDNLSVSHMQTINQLLAEMDTIEDDQNEGLFVIGTTNRIESIDPALLRAGRLDWQIHVPLPNDPDRTDIITQGLEKIKANPSVKINDLVDRTIGYSSADIINVINEAAIDAAVNNKPNVDEASFDSAFSKVSAYQLEASPILPVKILTANEIKTRFKDIAGMNEAKREVTEVVDFLKDPAAFTRLGAKPPKGIIIYGPPGTGKTLMARAIAGEADATFIAVSGSDFDDKYVGVGTKRVKELFKLAKKYSPSIVFIDEIDGLASARGNEEAPYHDQIVNQFLNELDNVQEDKNEGIIFIGATNRIDSLDPAVLRPGRFDRKVYFRLPSIQEREQILKLYLAKIKHVPEINVQTLAQMTPGYSGADLANLVNEAAIEATRLDKPAVDMASFEEANDKISMGVSEGTSMLSQGERIRTAYHEAGHALVGLLSPSNPRTLHKMTIGIRGGSLGVTHFKLVNESYGYTKKELEALIATAFGGYVAEELVYGTNNISAGASSDLNVANRIAKNMIGDYALGDNPNFLTLEIFPEDIGTVMTGAEQILRREYEKAKLILTKNRDKLELLAQTLLVKETMDYEQIIHLLGIKPGASQAIVPSQVEKKKSKQ